MAKMIHTNCSEESFKLVGNLAEIKTELSKMIDVVIGENSDSNKDYIRNIENARKLVNKAKDIYELEQIVFEFTCNYETFFRVDDEETLSVATCNNHEWDEGDVRTVPTDEDYYDIAGYEYYNEIFNCDGYSLLIHEKEDGKTGKIIKKDMIIIKIDDNDGLVNEDYIQNEKQYKLVHRGENYFYIANNGLVKVNLISIDKVSNEFKKMMILEKLQKN